MGAEGGWVAGLNEERGGGQQEMVDLFTILIPVMVSQLGTQFSSIHLCGVHCVSVIPQ